MKKAMLTALLFAFSLTLFACNKALPDESFTPQAERPHLAEPPSLTVCYGNKETALAMCGNYTLEVENPDGTRTITHADGLHPISAADMLNVAYIRPSTLSSVSPFVAYLHFDVAPDHVSIRVWMENDDISGDGEYIVVNPCDGDKDDPQFTFNLREYNAVYEVIASWSGDTVNGSARYAFRSENAIPKVEE